MKQYTLKFTQAEFEIAFFAATIDDAKERTGQFLNGTYRGDVELAQNGVTLVKRRYETMSPSMFRWRDWQIM